MENSIWYVQALPSYDRQRRFISDMVSREKTSRGNAQKRHTSLKYFLAFGNKQKRVCKDLCPVTLDVGKKTALYTLERKQRDIFCGEGTRVIIHHIKIINDSNIKFAHEHLKSFPRMESHYTRQKHQQAVIVPQLKHKKRWALYNKEKELKL